MNKTFVFLFVGLFLLTIASASAQYVVVQDWNQSGATAFNAPFRFAAGSAYQGSNFQANETYTTSNLTLKLKAFGAPTGNFWIGIYNATNTTNYVLPLIATSNNISSSSINTSVNGGDYTFSINASLVAGNYYSIALFSDTAISGVNYFRTGATTVGGTYKTWFDTAIAPPPASYEPTPGVTYGFITYRSTSGLLTITASDAYNSTAINTFNASIQYNGSTTQYTTTNGTIITNLLISETIPANVTLTANNYFNTTQTNVNATPLIVSMTPYTAIRAFALDGSAINEFNLNWTNVADPSEFGTQTVTNGLGMLPLFNATYDITIYDATNSTTNFAMETETLTANPYLQGYNFTLYLTNSILFSVYEENTQTLINNATSTIYLTGDLASYNFTTTTGFINATLITPDTYTITFTANGYNQRQILYTLTNQTARSIGLYLLATGNSSTIETFFDNQNLQRIEGVNVTLSRKNLSGTNYYDVYGCSADANGRCIINAQILTATYRLCYAYGVFSACSGDLQFTSNDVVTGRTFQLTTTTSTNDYYAWNTLGQTAVIVFSPNSTSPNGSVTFNLQNSALVATQVCLELYRYTGNNRALESTTCSTGGATSVMTVTGYINVSQGGDSIQAIGSATINGVSYEIVEDSIVLNNTSLSSQGQRLSLLVVIVATLLTLIFSYTWNPVAPPFITAFILYVFWSIGLLVVTFSMVMWVVGIAAIVWLIIGRRT